MKTPKHLIIFILLLISKFSIAQKSVYYYRGTGVDTLTLFDNKTFQSSGGVGLAVSIEYSGIYTIKHDTLVLQKTTPIVINRIDTNFHHVDNDTLLVIDDLTLILINGNHYSFYKLIEKYGNSTLRKSYQWSYVEKIVNDVRKAEGQNRIKLHKYPIHHGYEIHYDKNGKIEKKYIWKNGKSKRRVIFKNQSKR